MSYQANEIVLDLGIEARQRPIPRFVSVIVFIALQDSAERIEFSLLDALPEATFRVSYSVKGLTHDISPPPRHLFEPVVVALCTYASVPYYAKGPVRGRIETRNPASSWLLESEDLRKHVVLSKT
jgi:hypothetical protein